MFSEGRILSRPLGIEWAGWRSDTLRLQQSGWRLAVNFEPARHQYQLLMKHEGLRLCALTEVHVLENMLSRLDADLSRLPVFRVTHVAPDIQVRQVACSMLAVNNFEEIDATPQFVREEIKSMYDLNVFSTMRTEQVLIDKADMTVIEHLEAIKAMQSPKQQEIRKRMLRDEPQRQPVQRPQLHLVAQLVHYAEAA